MTDPYEEDSVREILRTQGFRFLLKRIETLAETQEATTLTAAAHDPLDSIRFKAGRASGVRLVLDMLKKT